MKTWLFTLLLGLCSATLALGGEADIRLGTFDGKWGGIPCRYELTWQEPGKLRFLGKIYLINTKQYDNLEVQQRGGLLLMFRTLQGKETGRSQIVKTFPPETKRSESGKIYYLFRGNPAEKGGPGMAGTYSYLRMYAR